MRNGNPKIIDLVDGEMIVKTDKDGKAYVKIEVELTITAGDENSLAEDLERVFHCY